MPPTARPVCREITMLIRKDRRLRTSTFKVWARTGLSGEDAPRIALYEGDNFAEAYDHLIRNAESIEDWLIDRRTPPSPATGRRSKALMADEDQTTAPAIILGKEQSE